MLPTAIETIVDDWDSEDGEEVVSKVAAWVRNIGVATSHDDVDIRDQLLHEYALESVLDPDFAEIARKEEDQKRMYLLEARSR
ncbi:hypothetical protein VNI00_016089 [Paramarasmius palmivorus]|uniref:Uncharacterized protein n=1 Tax=Paramarasmius palmivorus TaxID=297713 RepID=A0AAW0BHR4_9AGAR